MKKSGLFASHGGDPQDDGDWFEPSLVLWEPVRPREVPFWSSSEISDDPPRHSQMAAYTGGAIPTDDTVTVLTPIQQGTNGVANRQGEYVAYNRLELSVLVNAPYLSTFDYDICTLALFWDRTYPTSVSAPSTSRYLALGLGDQLTRPMSTLPDVICLWAKDYVMDEPRWNAVANPLRPTHQTLWVDRVALDLSGLMAHYNHGATSFDMLGPGQLVLVNKCAFGGLAVASLLVQLDWRIYFSSPTVGH